MTQRLTLGVLLSATTLSVTLALAAADKVRGEVATRVDTYLTRLVPFGWSGAVLVAQNGEVVLNKGYGLANRARTQLWTSDTVGNIGSITKQFTAAAILRLEARGRLSVRDPMAKYLPGVPADKSAITLHHLLTHTSGLRGDLGGTDEEPIGRDELAARVLASPLAHPPGEAFEYSNEGYSLLAAIVERVSGKPYEQFLHDELFVPARMTKTGYLIPAYKDNELALGYRADGSLWGLVYKRQWRPEGPGWYLTGNGGIQSTTGDLYQWHLALEGDAILPATERTKLFTPYVPTRGGDHYGYGWGIEETQRGTKVISHNGGNGIYSADFRRYVEEKTVIITMGNAPVIPAAFIGKNRIEPLVFNPTLVPMPPAIIPVPEAVRTLLAGDYTLAGGGKLAISVTPAGLMANSSEVKVAGVLQGFVAPGGRFADIEKKTTGLVTASAKGDFQPVVEAFVGDRTLGQVQAGQGGAWKQWQRDLGNFTGFEIAGVTFNDGDPMVVARLRFASGVAYAQYAWGPRRLLGFMSSTELPAADFQPESATSYVRFDYRRPTPIRLVFTANADHKVTATITGNGSEFQATRVK